MHTLLQYCLRACASQDNRDNVNLGWGKTWLQVHASNAKALGKPLVIEEWGKFIGGPLIQE